MTGVEGPSEQARPGRLWSAFPCIGHSYLSTGRAEPEDPLELVMECDGGATGDCGWHVLVEQEPYMKPEGTWDVTIGSDQFLRLHQQHLNHRAAAENDRGHAHG